MAGSRVNHFLRRLWSPKMNFIQTAANEILHDEFDSVWKFMAVAYVI